MTRFGLLLPPVKRPQSSCWLFCHCLRVLRKEKEKKKKKKKKKEKERKKKKKKRGKKRRVLDYCCLEALDTNMSMVLASMTSGAGHSSLWWFSAGMSSAGTGLCSVSGCENCWLCLRRWRGGVGWSLFLIPSVAMMLWILHSIANRAVFLRSWGDGPL